MECEVLLDRHGVVRVAMPCVEQDVGGVEPRALSRLAAATRLLLPAPDTAHPLAEPPLQGPGQGLQVSLFSRGEVQEDL